MVLSGSNHPRRRQSSKVRLQRNTSWRRCANERISSGRGNAFQLTVDRAPTAEGYPALVVANLRCYGKGWTMTPDASPTTGRLHYQARKRRGPLFILWQILAAMLHRRVPAFVSDYGTGQHITITASEPFAFQVDGDDRGDTRELRLEAQPASAVFVVPADALRA